MKVSKVMLRFIYRFSALAGVIALLPLISFSQNDFTIYPGHIIFDEHTKTEQVTFLNKGEDTLNCTLLFVQFRANMLGELEQINQPDSGQLFAHTYLRVSPQAFIAAPGESQIIELELLPVSGMEEGEYRSYLHFVMVSSGKQPGDKGILDSRKEINPDQTIPVLIRVGKLSAEIYISQFEIEVEYGGDAPPILSFMINREGNQSVIGDLTVEHLSHTGKKTLVGQVDDLAVYYPNPQRHFTIRLAQQHGIDFTGGKLLIRYSSPKVLYAESEFYLN